MLPGVWPAPEDDAAITEDVQVAGELIHLELVGLRLAEVAPQAGHVARNEVAGRPRLGPGRALHLVPLHENDRLGELADVPAVVEMHVANRHVLDVVRRQADPLQLRIDGHVRSAVRGHVLDERPPVARIVYDLVIVPSIEEDVALRVRDDEESDRNPDRRARRPRLQRALQEGYPSGAERIELHPGRSRGLRKCGGTAEQECHHSRDQANAHPIHAALLALSIARFKCDARASTERAGDRADNAPLIPRYAQRLRHAADELQAIDRLSERLFMINYAGAHQLRQRRGAPPEQVPRLAHAQALAQGAEHCRRGLDSADVRRQGMASFKQPKEALERLPLSKAAELGWGSGALGHRSLFAQRFRSSLSIPVRARKLRPTRRTEHCLPVAGSRRAAPRPGARRNRSLRAACSSSARGGSIDLIVSNFEARWGEWAACLKGYVAAGGRPRPTGPVSPGEPRDRSRDLTPF